MSWLVVWWQKHHTTILYRRRGRALSGQQMNVNELLSIGRSDGKAAPSHRHTDAHNAVAAGLAVLGCFGGSPDDAGGIRRSQDRCMVVGFTGLPYATVDGQLRRLTQLGYLEKTTDHSYRLSRRTLGEPEILAWANRGSVGRLTRRRGQSHGDDGIHDR